MDVRLKGGLGGSLMSTLQHLMDLPVVVENALNAPTQTCVRDAGAVTATPADVKELPGSYVFVVDMPGVKPDEIEVQLEDDRVLAVSGVRRRKDEEADQVKCLRMERRMGKFMRRFRLAENANADAITASCKDGVLNVTVEKLPPPRPRKPKMIEVKIA